jgi:hypothetical protein
MHKKALINGKLVTYDYYHETLVVDTYDTYLGKGVIYNHEDKPFSYKKTRFFYKAEEKKINNGFKRIASK